MTSKSSEDVSQQASPQLIQSSPATNIIHVMISPVCCGGNHWVCFHPALLVDTCSYCSVLQKTRSSTVKCYIMCLWSSESRCSPSCLCAASQVWLFKCFMCLWIFLFWLLQSESVWYDCMMLLIIMELTEVQTSKSTSKRRTTASTWRRHRTMNESVSCSEWIQVPHVTWSRVSLWGLLL